jgi:hypothetical protein
MLECHPRETIVLLIGLPVATPRSLGPHLLANSQSICWLKKQGQILLAIATELSKIASARLKRTSVILSVAIRLSTGGRNLLQPLKPPALRPNPLTS